MAAAPAPINKWYKLIKDTISNTEAKPIKIKTTSSSFKKRKPFHRIPIEKTFYTSLMYLDLRKNIKEHHRINPTDEELPEALKWVSTFMGLSVLIVDCKVIKGRRLDRRSNRISKSGKFEDNLTKMSSALKDDAYISAYEVSYTLRRPYYYRGTRIVILFKFQFRRTPRRNKIYLVSRDSENRRR